MTFAAVWKMLDVVSRPCTLLRHIRFRTEMCIADSLRDVAVTKSMHSIHLTHYPAWIDCDHQRSVCFCSMCFLEIDARAQLLIVMN